MVLGGGVDALDAAEEAAGVDVEGRCLEVSDADGGFDAGVGLGGEGRDDDLSGVDAELFAADDAGDPDDAGGGVELEVGTLGDFDAEVDVAVGPALDADAGGGAAAGGVDVDVAGVILLIEGAGDPDVLRFGADDFDVRGRSSSEMRAPACEGMGGGAAQLPMPWARVEEAADSNAAAVTAARMRMVGVTHGVG